MVVKNFFIENSRENPIRQKEKSHNAHGALTAELQTPVLMANQADQRVGEWAGVLMTVFLCFCVF